ncbi:sigma-54 interacting transcriptional regulator [Scopulibacillus darangshiensis]|uniref:Sigma-54 interacting transcriptional regulator n=1 Tax=Scopulibacillus darangshiensis TaxID=442528 RepID=A0A4R2NK63_9BACL|nr:sigma 54-interacting transcriptional regulator [Scopulibacillus darangshiensis]TCP21870.1 sigma-54 interacting transcriptional regulator [Scopulibacillus darangshiensis]
MANITQIRDFTQECADNLSKVIGLDVTVIDENNIRISGTGFHRELIGKPVPAGSFFETILKTGRPGMIFDRRENGEKCRQCLFNKQCTELATMGFPITKRNKPVGVIGFIGFTSGQREMIEKHARSLTKFLQHMSTLFENKLLLRDLNEEENCQVHEQVTVSPKRYIFDDIVGENEGFQRLIQKARKIADSPSTVLLRGESGTGKELIARAIHFEGKRRKQPFISVNCSAIPDSLLESELFGYEGGAFTGAKRQGCPGKFELADGGTIFLDEVGDLPLAMQPKLLRVLQERCIERVGGKNLTPLNIRIIAATNKDLEAMVKNGSFREDLYYRLNVIPLTCLPLKERRGDIPALLTHFIKKYGNILNKNMPEMSSRLLHALGNHDWPGNIRQLENVVEYMINMNDTGILDIPDLPDYMGGASLKPDRTGNKDPALGLTEMTANFERSTLLKYLYSDNGTIDKAAAAKKLKISLATLYRKLEKHGIEL